MNILYITPYVPSLIRTRPYNLIQALVQLGHRITLLTVSGSPTEEQPQVEALRDTGVYVEVFPLTVTRSLINCLQAVPTDDPLQAVYASHPAMARRISELLREGEFDVMHIEHLRAAKLVSAVPPSCRQRLPIIYDSVDSISLLFEQAAHSGAQWRSRIMAAIDLNRTRRYEAQLMTQYDHVVITSRRDREALEQLARQYLPPDAHTAPVTVITNGVDLDYFRPQERDDSSDHPTVIFTGKMSYHANITAALRFAREVLPRVWAHDPDVRFQVVGKDPPEAVRRLAADRRIEVTGTVDDLRPYLSRATAAVCPVNYAAGIQNKVLEAMAMGRPVICTLAAFASLDAQEGEDALVARDSEELAACVLRVCSDPSLAQRLGNAGRRYVEEHHNWRDVASELVKVYERTASEVSKRGACIVNIHLDIGNCHPGGPR